MATAQNSTVPLDQILNRDPEFLKEFWALYFLGIFIIILRFPVRIRMVGVKDLKYDDYAGIITLATWLSCMTLVEQVHVNGTNVDVTQNDIDHLSQESIQRLVYGSKCQLGAWYCYTALLWSMKATILLFYKRLIGQLWHDNVFRCLSWFAALSYCGVVLTISLNCLPFHQNWQVNPLPSPACTFKLHNLIVTTTLNISTDALILILPIPILKELNVNMVKKISLMLLLCSGLFVIGAAIMRLVNTLGGQPSTVTVNRWGLRECLVGVTAINAPVLRPLFTRSFWSGRPHVDAAPAAEDHLAHPPGAELENRGFYKDSVLGWMKSTINAVETWVSTGKTAITLPTFRPRGEETLARRYDTKLSTIPSAKGTTSGHAEESGRDNREESLPVYLDRSNTITQA